MRPFLVLLPVAALGIAFDMHDAAYTALDEHGDPFRTAFNADIGKTRVLMLVAPT